MSGYLHRLVAGAVRAEDTVRPLLGSIFAGGALEQGEDTVQLPVATQVATPPREAMQPRSAEPGPAHLLPRENAPITGLHREQHVGQPVAEAPRPYVPLLPFANLAAELPMMVKPHRVQSEPVLQSELAPREAKAPLGPAVERPQHNEQPREIHNFSSEAVVPEKQEWASAQSRLMPQPTPARIAPLPASRPKSAERRAESRLPEQHDRGPVQVHIGRIEVIAAPPASAPVAPRPSRSTSLHDYLLRGNGRAR